MLHPFHIHVNPFYVVATESLYSDKISPLLWGDYTAPFLDRQVGTWRDTVMVPPFGSVTIRMCFDAGTRQNVLSPEKSDSFKGKFVFHCHFLIHEDTGLLKNVNLRHKQHNLTRIAARLQEEKMAPGFEAKLRKVSQKLAELGDSQELRRA
jgi:FtsP/CotA-like multicopper oxidase with cupredoxin domain